MRLPRKVRIGTVNLDWGMTPTQLARAGRKVGRRLDLAGYQELRSTSVRAAVRRGLGKGWGWRAGGECPQSFRRRRVRPIKGTHKVIDAATPGLAGVTPRLPIHRMRYHHAKDPAIQWSAIATHLVPLTLHGRPRADHQTWRRQHWDAHWERLSEEVRSEVAAGFTTVVMLDGNNIDLDEAKIRQLHPQARFLARSGIDAVIVIPGASCGVSKGRRIRFGTGSDHAAIGAVARFTPARRP